MLVMVRGAAPLRPDHRRDRVGVLTVAVEGEVDREMELGRRERLLGADASDLSQHLQFDVPVIVELSSRVRRGIALVHDRQVIGEHVFRARDLAHVLVPCCFVVLGIPLAGCTRR